MATRFYLPASAAATPISPTPDAGWEDVSFMQRAMTRKTKINDALATVVIDDANSTDRDVLLRQYISKPLAVGQTITGAQALEAQCRVIETTTGNNMFFAMGIRVIAANGTTVQKTVLAVTRDATEASATTLTNRRLTATSAATNYTTVLGDRLVIEIGMAGDPGASNPHDSSMRLGDSGASDLAEDDVSTVDNNPWVELVDTLVFDETATFTAPASAGASFAALADTEASLVAGAQGAVAVSGLAGASGSIAAGAEADDSHAALRDVPAAISAGAEGGEAFSGEITEAPSAAANKQWWRWSFELFDDEHIFNQFPASAGEGENEGAISEHVEAGATFDAVVNALGSITAGASAGESMSGVAAALASLLAAIGAGEQGQGIADSAGAMSSGAQASAVFAAISQAAAAINAGVEAGEAWAVQAQALGLLLAPVAAGDSRSGLAEAFGILGSNVEAAAMFQAATEGAEDAAMSAESTAAATFLGAVQSLAHLFATANAGADFDALTGFRGSLVAGVQAGATFSGRVDSFGLLTAGALAEAIFEFPSEVRMIIGSVLIAARIASTGVSVGPALSGAVTIEPALRGDVEIVTP